LIPKAAVDGEMAPVGMSDPPARAGICLVAQRDPIHIDFGGAASPKLFAHVVEYADGWMPLGGGGLDTAIPELRRTFEAAGRDPSSARVIVSGALPDEAKLDRLRVKGADEALFFLPSGDRDVVLPALDQCAAVANASRAG
jgi:alkanesulfonate monooxygenase SsuD/methylene tetrahydromethanopterin reductase-like flavin-dependent oxidoreductase (luciferase family)